MPLPEHQTIIYPAQMAPPAYPNLPVTDLRFKTGSFAKKADGTGEQVVTGLGFTPKVLIFYWSGSTAYDSWGGTVTSGLGVAESENSSLFAIAASQEDGVSNSATGRSNDHCILIIDADQNVIAEATITSYDADGFTLNWTTNDANATIISFIALGGPVLTNSNVVNYTIPKTTGDTAVTGAGFQPDLVFHFYNSRINSTDDTTYGHASLGFGVMDGTTEYSVQAFWQDGDSGQKRAARIYDDSAISGVTTTPSLDFIINFSSMDADGFTLTATDPPFKEMRVYSLCLKGITTYIGEWDKPATSTGNESVSDAPWSPIGMLYFGDAQTLPQLPASDGYFMFGAADNDSNVSSMAIQRDRGSDNSQMIQSNTKLYQRDDPVTVVGDSTAVDASFVSFDVTGHTWNWTTNDVYQDDILYVYFRDVTVSEPSILAMDPCGTSLVGHQREEYGHPYLMDFQELVLTATLAEVESVFEVYSSSTTVIFPVQTQYQGRFQPIFLDDFGEAPGLDKWYRPLDGPVPPLEALDVSLMPFQVQNIEPIDDIPTIGEGEQLEACSMAWDNSGVYAHWQEPGQHPSLNEFTPYFQEPAEEQPHPEIMQSMEMGWDARTDPEAHLAPFQQPFYDPITASTAEDEMPWYRQFDQEYRPDPPPMDVSQMPFQPWFAEGRVETVTMDKWYAPLSEPVRPPEYDQYAHLLTRPDRHSVWPVPPPVEHWYEPLSKPVEPRPDLYWGVYVQFQEFFVETDVGVILDAPVPPGRVDDEFERRRRTDDAHERRSRTDDTFYRPRRGSDWTDRK